MTQTEGRTAPAVHVQVHSTGGALGAEVHGLDLRSIDDRGFETVRSLLLDHLVLFFPGQDLTPDEHVAFATRFGEAEIHPFIPKLDDDHPEIVVLRADDGYVADVWHTDVTFDASPPLCSVLQAHTMPRSGGDTMWSNQYLAYERLAEPMRAMLDGLTAIHSAANYGHPERQAEHPVVRRHPETGRPCLFVNRQFTRRIPQLGRDESEALLAFLFDWSSQPHFTCRYSWAPGTIGLWDNRCTQHLAVNDFEEPRMISRVTILGDVPEAAFGAPRWEPHQPRRTSAAASGLDRA
ncbi:TauD/TfdA dioxygenase family protein [Rhabdothermincola salaria]|uniref:TauD/TfdA dioxygenase family protein n=1 Tax=Rhabdothermincola salaria TaxID=2903142 RepID=UPI001E2CAB15|nr:TauD/TfdA family dioxygenase [Rhabdothermincola salaria]MCD9625061.1 TauD/TfdA family dioxygenase [Rhabdothermincola salaria]